MRVKVIARILGGIGNQLFCYAASRRLALVNNAELVIDDVSGFVRDHAYQRRCELDNFSISCRKAMPSERLEPFSRVRRYLKRTLNRHRPFEDRNYIQQEGVDFDPRLLQVKARGTVYLEGYWQSEGYFKDVEAIIRSDLKIKPPTDAVNLNMAACIRERNAIAIHVRFFDEPNGDSINGISSDYYARAVAHMEKTLAPRAHYFVFSDRPDAARLRIPLPDARVTRVTHNQGTATAYADLWLMAQCRHFIIANSTFSWWGAWLAEHAHKQIIVPGVEMRAGQMFWGFAGLLPREWIKL